MPSLPSNLYSGGAVTFDSQPFVNFYAQTMARKQAKDEALDQYYQNQFKNVNPAGMRTQDIPFFTNKVNEWQKAYQQNKDAIRNPRLDGGRAASDFQARMQDALALAQQSKNEGKVMEQLRPILTDPKKRDLVPDDIIEKINTHELALDNPDRKSFQMSDLHFNPEPIDVKTESAFFGDIGKRYKMDEAVTGIGKGPNPYNDTVTTTMSFGKEAKEGIANAGINRYSYDRSFQHHIDTALKNKDSFDKLNSVYRKEFGKDIESGQEGAIAYALAGVQDTQTKQKLEENWAAKQDKLFAQRKQLQDRALVAAKEGKKDEGGWINEYVGVLKNQSLGGPKLPYKYKDGTVANEYDIPMDATLSKLLEKQKVQPDYLRYNPETGKFRPIYAKYETIKEKQSDGTEKEVTRIAKGKDGKFAVDETLSQPLSEPQLVLALGGRVTPTQRTVEMKRSLENQQSKGGYKLNGKTYSKKELNDLGYDDDEIDQFIKGGLIQQ